MKKNTVWLSVIMLPMFAVAVRGGEADVDTIMKMIPADMAVTFVVSDFEAVNAAALVIAKKLDPETDGTGGPLDDIKRDLKMGEWIDFSKPFALAMSETDWNGVLFFGVVPEFEKKAKSLEGAAKTDDVWKLVYGEGEGAEALYAMTKGPFIVGATDKALLKGVGVPDKSLASELKSRGDIRGDRKVLIHINMDRVRDVMLGSLAQAAQMAPMLAMMAGPQSGVDPNTMTSMFTALIEASTKFAEQVAYLDVTLEVGAKAIDATIATGYKEGPIKSYLANQKPARGTFFDQLADQPYLFAIGYEMPGVESPFMAYMIEKVFGAMRSAAPQPTAGPDGEVDAEAAAAEAKVRTAALDKSLKQSIDLYSGIEGFNMVFNMSENGIMEIGDYSGRDLAKIYELSKALLTDAESMMQQFGMGGAGYEALGTKKIGDTDVETYKIKMDTTNPAAAQAAAMLGPDNKFALGIKNKRVRFCLGDDKAMEQTFSTAAGKPLGSSKFVKEALAALPAKRNAVILLDIAGFIPAVGAMMGMPPAGPVPPGPPVSLSLSLSQEPARIDIHVPVRAIERIKQAVSPEESM